MPATRTSSKASITVDFTGPFFRKDPEKSVMENIRKMMLAFAVEGAEAARQGLATGSGERQLIRELGDRVADHVVGRVYSRSGNQWQTAAVVQVYNEGYSGRQAISLMAAAAVVERRTRAISQVTRQLRSARAVLRANLTEGIE